jgi:hypothetical protein
VRIARVLGDLKDDDPQANANLRSCDAGAVQGAHGVIHVGDEGAELAAIEIGDGRGDLRKQRMAMRAAAKDALGRSDDQFIERREVRVAIDLNHASPATSRA